jgi:hypothetical protein
VLYGLLGKELGLKLALSGLVPAFSVGMADTKAPTPGISLDLTRRGPLHIPAQSLSAPAWT